MLDECLRILRDNDLCVLATSDGAGKPHCSLMAYAAAADARALFCATQRDTRKYANMRQNDQVSLLIDTRQQACGPDERENVQALTLTCRARELEGRERSQEMQRLGEKHPQIAPIVESENTAVMAFEVQRLQLLKGAVNAFYLDVSNGWE